MRNAIAGFIIGLILASSMGIATASWQDRYMDLTRPNSIGTIDLPSDIQEDGFCLDFRPASQTGGDPRLYVGVFHNDSRRCRLLHEGVLPRRPPSVEGQPVVER